jgi:hypothetical protein
MANIEEVVIRIDVKSPDNEDGQYYVTSDLEYGYFLGKTRNEAIAACLAALSASYKVD